MRWLPALLLVSFATVGCRSARPSACESISVACDTDAPRPLCATISSADSSTYISDVRTLVGLVPRAEVARLREEMPYFEELFGARTVPSDSVWVYGGSFVLGGMRMGDDGLIALRGCRSVALYPVISYN